MLHVVCIQSGNYCGRGADYVNILFDSVRRNLDDGYEGRFICFTDDPSGLDPLIESLPLPADLPGWWSKLALFRPGLFPDGDRVAFFDLDTLITGPLDAILSYDGDFAILSDFFRPGGLQSSVMLWRAGTQAHIWESYVAAGYPQDDEGGDQSWIERCHPKVDLLQAKFPGAFVSYKLTQGPPPVAAVVCFHGRPRPHEVVDGWVPDVWKIGGMGHGELKAICNTAIEHLHSNIRSAAARNLPWFDITTDSHEEHAILVGGGPSLVACIDEIRRRRDLGQHVWALNNSAAYLLRNGIVPDAHVILDARPENADFVRLSHPDTVYYIASQCDPAVFDALEDRQVVLWHVNSEGVDKLLSGEKDRPVHLVGGGNTVGLNAMSMAFLIGFRKVHCYGFDSCYADGAHHAYAQPLNDSERIIDVLFDGKRYRAAPWMAGQAEEFVGLAAMLEEFGCTVTVHGSGLLPDMYRQHQYAGVMSFAEQRAAEVLKRLNGAAAPRGVEVGVFTGRMSRALLRHPTLHLTMVDSWEGAGASYQGDSGDFHAELSQESQDTFFDMAHMATADMAARRSILRKRSTDAARAFDDGSLDFVFIDADHSYEGCSADIAAWYPKVRSGGVFGGHDYENHAYPKYGVTRAVKEFAAQSGLELDFGENYTWFVTKPRNKDQAA